MKMKQILLTAVIAIMSFSIGAQDAVTMKLSKENKELLEKLELEESLRLQRVQDYLATNPNTKVTLKGEGINISYIYDIYNNKPIYRSTENLQAARATKTVELWSGGNLGLSLDGAGMTVGVWDGGPADSGHVEFLDASGTVSRVTIIDGGILDGDDDLGFSSHGTHVTGTIAASGANPIAKGMASAVSVKSYNWGNDQSEMVGAANDATNPIILSNHSYGLPINQDDGEQLDASFIGSYTQGASSIDNIAKNNPKYLMVMSAGNSGQVSYTGSSYSGYDKLTDDKNAKNSLIIANANPVIEEMPVFSGNYEITNLTINASSSQGPTDDLRIKPDIAADGSFLTSTVPNGGYGESSGTSMAAPNTTGTLVLLQQYYNQLNSDYMNSSTLRGLVCHTAVDDGNLGPDPKFGWGFLNAREAAQTITDANMGTAVIDEITLNNNQVYTYTFTAQAGDNLKATICWTDMPGAVSNGAINDTQARLVNDLDLRLTKDGVSYEPWKLDFSPTSGYSNSKGDNIVDNIERVDIDVPTSGVYTLTVTHKGTLKGNAIPVFGPQTQDFGLIITGNNLTLSSPDNVLSKSLVVYPNPNNGEFVISFDSVSESNEDVGIDIFDISGRKVFSNIYSNRSVRFNEAITLGEVESGIYIVNITQGNNKTSQKIIIE